MYVSEQQAATDQHNQAVKKATKEFKVLYVLLFLGTVIMVNRAIPVILSWVEPWIGVRLEGLLWFIIGMLVSLAFAICVVLLLHDLVKDLARLAYRTSPPSN